MFRHLTIAECTLQNYERAMRLGIGDQRSVDDMITGSADCEMFNRQMCNSEMCNPVAERH